ncbi:MAG: LLM class flavin-dependent oxidoreductase, partial [Anaerolineae bacterium]|nr:LLM class flavin-dependent oxidoreductase [Anaerolineae bacterium]
MVDLGVMFRREQPPETLCEFARQAEAVGLAELWIVEDCFYASGIASVATALACTEHIKVGLGIAPAVMRNAALTAMEFATLARMYPGRFLPGIGHGVREWMDQIGALPPSQLTALEEVSLAVRALLRGETLHMTGGYVKLEDVTLEFPPSDVPPVQLGVRGEKSLRLSGRSADGTLLTEGSGPAYVRWAREQIAAGQAEAGHPGAPHRVTVYAWSLLGADSQAARDAVRPTVAQTMPYIWKQLAPLGIVDEAQAILDAQGFEGFAAAMPDEWLDLLAIAGTPEDCAAGVQRLVAAGADAVVFAPPHEHV